MFSPALLFSICHFTSPFFFFTCFIYPLIFLCSFLFSSVLTSLYTTQFFPSLLTLPFLHSLCIVSPSFPLSSIHLCFVFLQCSPFCCPLQSVLPPSIVFRLVLFHLCLSILHYSPTSTKRPPIEWPLPSSD